MFLFLCGSIHLSPRWGLLFIGWINVDYTPVASLRLWKITYQHPTNHDEYQTRIRPSAFGVDLAEYHTRIHSVDFGAKGVYRTRISKQRVRNLTERLLLAQVLIYLATSNPTSEDIP